MILDLDPDPPSLPGAVRPLLRPSVPHFLHNDLLGPAGGGVRRELQEELLHRVLQDRRPGRGPDLRRAPRQGLRRPRARGLQVCGVWFGLVWYPRFAGMRGPMNANKAAIVLRLSNLL